MATLVLGVGGRVVGGMLGGPLGAMIGGAAGALAGSVVDRALFAPKPPQRFGPRLHDLHVQASTEGAPIPKVYGRARIAGQVIWATRFEESITVTGGGGGGKGSPAPAQPGTIEFRYFANFAVGLAEGPVDQIGRVWADGKELDIQQFEHRFYSGSQDQMPDPLIEAREGGGNAPAFRGLSYIVFERMPLEGFGRRIPQLSFEVFRALDETAKLVRAVTIIPGSTEWGYEPEPVFVQDGRGGTDTQNRHNTVRQSDWALAMTQLQGALPNVERAALVVAWFGDDLRVGECRVAPKVEQPVKATWPRPWTGGGVAREAAGLVSTFQGRPAYGSTPDDISVFRAIQDLKARGRKVTFYPFILMDVPHGNGLPDPYTGSPGQPPFPWRGRITVDPAPGRPGTVDKTPAAAAQVAAFFGSAAPGHFAFTGTGIAYSGPDEWSLRRMVLHYAHLCRVAGGVDAFIIASELRGITQVRDGASHYPAVDALVALAADVRSILGAQTKISYAADWSEYFGHQPQDGSGDVHFHLDPLWADANVDFIAIDNYMPLADWRDGTGHADALAGAPSVHDLDYLRANIAGGEGYDYYYASQGDRAVQARTAITDGSHGKPWVFRNKDLKGWWSNPHINWPGGVESGAPTAWVPQSKPIWFTELGCPAVDKGANQPNVFIDPKSSESFLPHHSSGVRDDMMQRRFIEAHMRYWGSGDTEANPVSAVYGGPMVDPGAIHIWTWDARPFPAFPLLRDVWADGANWQLGHWLTGRLGSAPLAELVTAIMEAFGFTAFDVSGLRGIVDGYVIDSTMSVRQALEPLGAAFFFDGVESDGIIRFRHWGGGVEAELGIADLTEPAGPDDTLFELRRAQETELPRMARIGYSDSAADYRRAAAEAKRLVGGSSRVETSDVAMVMPLSQAQAIVDVSLQDAWAARETLMLSLPPSRLALEPGDTLSFDRGGGTAPATFQIVSISDGVERGIEARSIEASVFQAAGVPLREPTPKQPVILGPGILDCLDLPLIDGEGPAHAGYFAAFARPWHGQMAVLRSPSDTGFIVNRLITAPAIMGETLWDLHAGPQHRWDRGNRVQVTLYGGALHSADALAVLNGANRAAIRHPSGAWEIIQFRDAQLVAPDTYELSMLLRGQFGTGDAMGDPVPAGARFILLNATVVPAAMSANDIGLALNYRFGPAARDIADPAYRTLTHAFQGRGLRPLAPAHVKAVRPDGTADIALSWIRSTRIGGDAWEPVEVPLGEEQELYDLELIDPVSGSVVRTLSRLEAAAYTYGAAAQMEDFGAVIAWPQALRVRVYQVAPSHGRGVPADVAIHFPLPVRMG